MIIISKVKTLPPVKYAQSEIDRLREKGINKIVVLAHLQQLNLEVALASSLEGADIVMVKPGLCYLDIVRDIKNAVNIPVSVYQVSGEYAMVKSASQNKLISSPDIIIEILSSMKRAGANSIITYHAIEIAELLN